MSYFMDFVTDPGDLKPDDVVVALEGGGVQLRVDPKSLLYLFNLTLDYSDELIGGGYKVRAAGEGEGKGQRGKGRGKGQRAGRRPGPRGCAAVCLRERLLNAPPRRRRRSLSTPTRPPPAAAAAPLPSRARGAALLTTNPCLHTSGCPPHSERTCPLCPTIDPPKQRLVSPRHARHNWFAWRLRHWPNLPETSMSFFGHETISQGKGWRTGGPRWWARTNQTTCCLAARVGQNQGWRGACQQARQTQETGTSALDGAV